MNLKKYSFTFFLFFVLAMILSSSAVCDEKTADKSPESEKTNGSDLVFLLTPEFRQKVEEFKISPFEAALILFRDFNQEITSVEKLKRSLGTLRCVKGDDYVFSTTLMIPHKGVLMDGIYLNGFTGEYRVIAYSPNHPEKYAGIPDFGLCYYSDPLFAVSSKSEWLKIVESACPKIPEEERLKPHRAGLRASSA
ncbi:MAG: hypothetical protein ACI4UF_03985, partial [Thermoguttaceae bacterium]